MPTAVQAQLTVSEGRGDGPIYGGDLMLSHSASPMRTRFGGRSTRAFVGSVRGSGVYGRKASSIVMHGSMVDSARAAARGIASAQLGIPILFIHTEA